MNENNTPVVDAKEDNKSSNSPFRIAMENYIKVINAQLTALPLILNLLATKTISDIKRVQKFIKDHDIKIEDTKDDNISIIIPYELNRDFKQLNDNVNTSILASELLSRNIIVSLVSGYDAFIGDIIKAIFYTCPELLNNCEKNISLTDLLTYESIDEAKQRIIEKEVETVLRENHTTQFVWLEKKLNTTLRKDLPAFKNFIEITERRNLFVHNNGEVSRQYIRICKDNDILDSDVKLGKQLSSDPAYITQCYNTLFEIGIKLGHVIWRKIVPSDRANADEYLNDICFDLLKQKKYELAISILTFATDIKKHSSLEIKYTLIINKALAYYLTEKQDECEKILDSEDWSACASIYKLAVAILRNEYDQAVSIIKNRSIQLRNEVFREWPLFTKFRETQLFKDTYKEVYNEEFTCSEITVMDFEEVLNEALNIQKELKAQKCTE